MRVLWLWQNWRTVTEANQKRWPDFVRSSARELKLALQGGFISVRACEPEEIDIATLLLAILQPELLGHVELRRLWQFSCFDLGCCNVLGEFGFGLRYRRLHTLVRLGSCVGSWTLRFGASESERCAESDDSRDAVRFHMLPDVR